MVQRQIEYQPPKSDQKATNVFFENAKQREADVVRPYNPRIADEILKTKDFNELGALNKKYETLFRNYGIMDQIRQIYDESLKEYNEQKITGGFMKPKGMQARDLAARMLSRQQKEEEEQKEKAKEYGKKHGSDNLT